MSNYALITDIVEQRLLEARPFVRKLFFRNLEIQVNIGINDDEIGQSQNVLINITMYMATEEAPSRDSIAEVFNYDRVRDPVHYLIKGRHINLQETLVEEIADLCLEFNEIAAVRVSSEKTDVYEDCEGVGCEVVRFSENIIKLES